MIKKFTVGFFLLLIGHVAHAEKVYEFNTTCQQAYLEISKLKLAAGMALIEKAKQQNPDNLIPVLLENYIDFYTLFFNEDAAEYAKYKPKVEERIKLLEQGPPSSPFYKFCLGDVYLQKAAVEIKFVENWRAGWDVKKCYQLIKENKKTFPTFAPNDLILGMMQTIIATIPKGYTFFASILGMSGSLTEGIKMLNSFVNSNDPYAKLMNTEGSFVYCYLMYYIENKRSEVFAFIQNKKFDLINNHGLAFMASNLAVNNKQLDYAKNIIANRNKSTDYLQIHVWDYEMGFVKLYHLETQEAAKYFENYLASFKGNFYIKDTYLKLSWCYYLQGNMAAAEAAKSNVLKKGSLDTDADKQALREAKTGTWPNVILLKARFMNDGGLNREALLLLASKGLNSFTKDDEKLEYTYRLGRINDDLHNDAEAIKYYQATINAGADRKEYYAARSALQVGEIFERQGKKQQAITYYEKCMAMKDHEYKNSLDQKAKSGIARCKGE